MADECTITISLPGRSGPLNRVSIGLDTLVLILLPALDAERKKSEAEAAKLEAVQKEANELRQSYMTAMAHLREYQSKEEQNQTS